MARYEYLSRVLKIVHYLEMNPNGLRVKEIVSRLCSDGFNAKQRAVYHDLQLLQKVYPISNSDSGEDRGIWKLERAVKLSANVSLAYDELLALFVSRHILHGFDGSPLIASMNGLFDKIEKVLGVKASAQLEEFTTYLSIRPIQTWTEISREVLDTVHSATSEGQKLRIVYVSAAGENAGGEKERIVGPEGIYFTSAGAYMVAKDMASGEIRTYAIQRVREAEMLDESHEASGRSPESYFADAFGFLQVGEVDDVCIEVREPIAAFVAERRWHSSQQVTRKGDVIHLRMRVKVNDELARWVLGLGPCATIIEPSPLREMVARLAAEIVGAYGKRAA